MNYGYNTKKATRIPIEYVCQDCDFTTFEQNIEAIHYEFGHCLSSKLRVDLEEPDNTVQTEANT